MYLTITNWDAGGMKDVDGNDLDLNGTYALPYMSCLSYEFIGGTECDDPGDYLYAVLPGYDDVTLDVVMSLAFLGFRNTLCNGTEATTHFCPPGITSRIGRADVVIITPDDEDLTAFREFLCGTPATLSGSFSGQWDRSVVDPCAGGGSLETAYTFEFDWELST